MPAGLRVMKALGARDLLGPNDCFPIEGIRYIEEDGGTVSGTLSAGGGLGIRRTPLASALATVAAGSGVEIRWGTAVTGFEIGEKSVELQTSAGKLRGRILVAAVGLHSPLRTGAGLDGPTEPRERFGTAMESFVEMHLGHRRAPRRDLEFRRDRQRRRPEDARRPGQAGIDLSGQESEIDAEPQVAGPPSFGRRGGPSWASSGSWETTVFSAATP
jgi:2-polyprenyl-6-methoxyphenol hydroxylase-like FAD-dependent oxidoreductase